MIGTRDELLERIYVLEAAGLDQIMILPNFETRFQSIERVARELMT